MPRLARHLLIAAMLALYGTVSLCGSGLHAFAGVTHSGCPEDPGRSSVPKSDQSLRASTDNCLICQFHVQGQLPAKPIRQVHCPLVRPRPPAPRHVVVARERHLPSSPRAPPSAPASLS